MGSPLRRRMVYGKLPRDVEDELSKVHMEKVWSLLQEKFCFNIKIWKKEYNEYFQKLPHEVSEREAFVEFGAEFINPVLNIILKRDENHNTWAKLLKYVVKNY